MLTNPAVDWLSVCFRANPAYELVLFDRLRPEEQQALEAVGRDPDGYGILRPRRIAGVDASTLSAKFVSRDTALLWLTLQQPGPLPRYATEMLGGSCGGTIGQMVLDGVLEIESGGKMLSGPAASELICPSPASRTSSVSADNTLAGLSRRAIEYGAALEIDDPFTLACRLYDFNRVPASSEWRKLLPDSPAVERYLGIQEGATAPGLQKDWVRLRPESASSAWLAWNPIRRRLKQGATTYKLYVSPAPNHVRAAFEAAADVLNRCNAVHWKVGANLSGLLRPDKMVAYFSQMADLRQAAELILERLAGCPAQGVPFTSEIGGNGLVSSGIDPPIDEFAVPWLQGESWRVKICNRLAAALLLAKSAKLTAPASVRFAMERLRLEGIDPDTWAPAFSPALPKESREISSWS